MILHTIGFELSIDHPYKFLVEQIKKLTHTRQLEYITPPSNTTSASQTMAKMLNELVQYSMNFANDSVHTSLCLQFSPQLIATSCVYLAGHFAKVRPTPSNKKSWLEVLGYPDAESLSSICAQIIELIVDRRGSDVKAFQAIRVELEKLKEETKPGQKSAAPPPSTGTKVGSPRPPPPPSSPDRDPKRQRTS